MKLVLKTISTLLISLSFFVNFSSFNIAYGINHKTSSGFWTWNVSQLRPSLDLPLIALERQLIISEKMIMTRTHLFDIDKRIEPLYASLSKPYNKSIEKFIQKYKKSDDYAIPLAEYLRISPAGIYPNSKNKSKNKKKQFKRVILNPLALSFINLDKFRQKFSTNTYDLVLQSKYLKRNTKARYNLLNQTKTYLSAKKINQLRHYLKSKSNIDITNHLLPEFAQKMLNKFVAFKGPNCFHAAMGFQDKSLLTMERTNVRLEPNHHHLMINHDELWRIVNWYFYEINPKKTPLQYGDVIMFLDVPENRAKNQPAEYSWIIHASAYLFSDFVFSKGSKSPNSPYSIKTLNQEWQTWTELSSNLAVKVFRKSFDNFKQKSTVVSRSGWLY